MTNLASLGLVAANIMDAVVVGRQMGASGLAAIGMVSPIYVLYNILGYGFSVGGAVTFSKLMGKARMKLQSVISIRSCSCLYLSQPS